MKYSGKVKSAYIETQGTQTPAPAEMEKQSGGGGGGGGYSGERRPEPAANADEFYEKLGKLNEPSGLSLLFNFRQTMLDLHRFYDEVITRGGFYEVTKTGKWEEVASQLKNSKSCVSLSAAQLQSVYHMLILQYELMYSRSRPKTWRSPPKNGHQFGSEPNPSCSTGKRKHCHGEATGVETNNQNSTTTISPDSNVREVMVEYRKSPQKPRTGYHIFLRLESDRLRKVLGESATTQNLREMANAAWRRFSDKDKLPYHEASKMDRERYDREMAAYNQLHEKQNGNGQALFTTTPPKTMLINFSKPKEPNDDVYRVTYEDGSKNLVAPDESALRLAIEAMENAESNESIFRIDWDNNAAS